MKFSELAQYFSRIEATPKRLEITAILAELYKKVTPAEADEVSYLVLGQLAPSYAGIDFNLAEKMMVRVLAKAYAVTEEKAHQVYKKEGDLGTAAEDLAKGKKVRGKGRSITEVYQSLKSIAESSGTGSQEKKISAMANLLTSLDPLSARYVSRIPVNKLRMGFSDKTILDALSLAKVGDKSSRPAIERAYNVSADIGKIAQLVKSKGMKEVEDIKVEVGVPIRMAAAERLPSPDEIMKKMGGKLAAEPKYDGFRVQVHLDKSRRQEELEEEGEQLGLGVVEKEKIEKIEAGPWVKIFSRNLEDTAAMFPEIALAAQKLPVKSVIFEGEAIAYNPETEEFEPFQETAKRKRKYGIKEKATELPLKVFAFDLLYLDGKDLTNEPYEKRREKLTSLLKEKSDTIMIAEEQVFTDSKKLGQFFQENIEHGLEGIMTKRLDGVYQAGVRNFNWVKLKRVEEGKLEDTIDCVVLGYYTGRGKRTQFGIGGFLVAVYDDKEDTFKTISRVGSGLTDEEWREMKKRVDSLKTKEKPKNAEVAKEHTPDVWATPEIVVAIRADEITKSPLHTAGGLALRFPRLMAFRDDKKPEQATTVGEVEELFKQQKKR